MALTIYGKPECTDWARSRSLLDSHGLGYDFKDIIASEGDAQTAQAISGGPSSPVIVFTDGSFLVEPSDESLTEALSHHGMI